MPSHFLYVMLNFWFEIPNCDPTFWQEWICCSGLVQSPVETNLTSCRHIWNMNIVTNLYW